MTIIKQYHKDTDTTYVYESISYWDAEKRQSRRKQTDKEWLHRTLRQKNCRLKSPFPGKTPDCPCL